MRQLSRLATEVALRKRFAYHFLMSAMRFEELDEAGQRRILWRLARRALSEYDLDVRAVRFLRNGENAVFKVTAADGRAYALRIHRADYHTPAALEEELEWLARLGAGLESAKVPSPLASRGGDYAVSVSDETLARPRSCDLLTWMDGRFVRTKPGPLQFFEVGRALGEIHARYGHIKVRERRYWDSEGLVGKEAKFGCIENLRWPTASQRAILVRARRDLFARLARAERHHPEKLGFLHGDAHFSNVLFGRDGELRLIDFDDSGYGFFAYDLVIPLAALEYTSGTRANEHFARCREALFDGYQTMKPLDPVDVELVGWMLGARKLSLLNWLESRADNPRMVKVYPRFLSDALDHFRNGIPAE